MHIIRGRNVCDNYATAVETVQRIGLWQSSRAGDVLVADAPVTTVTECPCERVLTDPRRDANPFFHLFESLWMLTGARDARWLDRFVSDFSSRFAEEGGLQWGAYGHRWREHWGADQLDKVVQQLQVNPLDRRAVITMWDPNADLFAHPNGVRDLPCNLQVIPRMRLISTRHSGVADPGEYVLDLTITNRSNDVVWGCYGANAVHMSVLQEYLAGRIGCGVGTMYQMSNNWHAYTNTLERVGAPTGENLYANGKISYLPMGSNWDMWDQDLAYFMQDPYGNHTFKNDWFTKVAAPMWRAHDLWKSGERDRARSMAKLISAEDWRWAVLQWMERRT